MPPSFVGKEMNAQRDIDEVVMEVEAQIQALQDFVDKAKKLSHLIDDLAEKLPLSAAKLNKLRDYGNEYLHPKNSRISKEALFQRQAAAQDALNTLVDVVEELYLVRKRA